MRKASLIALAAAIVLQLAIGIAGLLLLERIDYRLSWMQEHVLSLEHQVGELLPRSDDERLPSGEHVEPDRREDRTDAEQTRHVPVSFDR